MSKEIKCLKIYPQGEEQSGLIVTFDRNGWDYIFEVGAILPEDAITGDKFTIEVIKMGEKEFEALQEWNGF